MKGRSQRRQLGDTIVQQRVHLITLGVRDLARAAAFYDALNWKRVEDPVPGIVVYNLYGAALGLYPLENLEKDIGRSLGSGSGSLTLACNSASVEEVDRTMADAASAGAEILKPAEKLFWGGYGGYFADPEGHIWEVAYNPFSPLGKNGEFQWGGA